MPSSSDKSFGWLLTISASFDMSCSSQFLDAYSVQWLLSTLLHFVLLALKNYKSFNYLCVLGLRPRRSQHIAYVLLSQTICSVDRCREQRHTVEYEIYLSNSIAYSCTVGKPDIDQRTPICFWMGVLCNVYSIINKPSLTRALLTLPTERFLLEMKWPIRRHDPSNHRSGNDIDLLDILDLGLSSCVVYLALTISDRSRIDNGQVVFP